MPDFEIIPDSEVEHAPYLRATTHPQIYFDELEQSYHVNIGKGGIATVYGENKADRALEIAEAFSDRLHNQPTR